MADTPNLDLLLIEVGAPNREVAINGGLTVLDSTVAGVLALDVAGSGDLTLTDTTTGQAKYGVLRLSGVLTGARTVLVPDKGRRYLVENATSGAFTLTVQTAAGAGVVVPQGTWGDLVCDGTDVLAALTSTGGVTPGTPLSVARYAADGATLEAAPLVVVDATGQLGVGTATPTALLSTVGGNWRQVREGSSTTFTQEVFISSPAFASNWITLRSYGTYAAREALPANVSLFTLLGRGMKDATTTGDGVSLLAVSDEAFTPTASGGRLVISTAQRGTTTLTERLRIDSLGNLSTGGKLAGTSGQKVLVLASGTAPSTSPTDAVQLWTVDRAATAGKAALHVRTEDGTSHVLGDLSGIGTLLTATLGAGASYQALNVNGGQLFVGQSSVQERPQALLNALWVSSTDATRTARLFLAAYDATAAREGVRVEADGSAARLGFYGGTAVVKPTVTGVRGGNTALASLLTALANLGLIVDSTTA